MDILDKGAVFFAGILLFDRQWLKMIYRNVYNYHAPLLSIDDKNNSVAIIYLDSFYCKLFYVYIHMGAGWNHSTVARRNHLKTLSLTVEFWLGTKT